MPQGKPIDLGADVDAYMAKQRNAGLIIVQDGKIRLEKYALGYGAAGRWTSFSVAKSFTSTLVGAAVKDGYIKSLDDKVTAYIPGLKGSAYDDVSVKQLLTMTSGVKWNEDYTDPKSDVALFNMQKPVAGEDITVSYMKTLPREAPAGSKWVYKTGETNLDRRPRVERDGQDTCRPICPKRSGSHSGWSRMRSGCLARRGMRSAVAACPRASRIMRVSASSS